MNLYPPGPRTSVFTGEATGVAKAVDAAIATVISMGYTDTSKAAAAATAIGATSTVVAVFDMNWENMDVKTNRPAIKAKGP